MSPRRFERLTYGFEARRSIQLSYGPMCRSEAVDSGPMADLSIQKRGFRWGAGRILAGFGAAAWCMWFRNLAASPGSRGVAANDGSNLAGECQTTHIDASRY